MRSPDFLSTNLGTVIQLSAITDAAVEWAGENLATEDGLAPVIHVEPRYFLDIARALLEAGLTLMDTATGTMAELPPTVH